MTKTPTMKGEQRRRPSTTRVRTKYTTVQLAEFEKLFDLTQYPDTAAMYNLSRITDVTMERISVWFQNRRSKFKRQARGGHVTWMRRQLYNGTGDNVQKPLQPTTQHVLSPPDTSCFVLPSTTAPSCEYERVGHSLESYNQVTCPVSPPNFVEHVTTPTLQPHHNTYVQDQFANDWLLLAHLLNDVASSQTDFTNSSCTFASPPYWQDQHNSDFYNCDPQFMQQNSNDIYGFVTV